jgi:hypothetical protein
MNQPKTQRTPQEIAKSLLNPKAYEEEQKLKNEAAQKKATIKPVIQKQAAPKIQQYYDVRVDTMLPATLHFRILAENAQQALDLIKGKHPNQVQHKLIGRKDIMAKVYNAGSSMLMHMKKFTGGW